MALTLNAQIKLPGLLRDFNEVETLQVSRKGPADFVSRADKRAEEVIFENLRRDRPGYGFLMEETGTVEGTDKSHRFIVDPLDGTTNYLHGIPHFAISIALERTFLGRPGHGKFLKELHQVMGASAGVRRLGAAALDLAWVAAGRYDGFWERELSIWDIAAGVLICREAGLEVESLSGGDLMSACDPIIANAELMPQLRKRVE